MSEPEGRIIFVTGLSGSGRTTTMNALEDLGFYAVDNIPPPLVEPFADLCEKASPPIRNVAMALDAREPAFLTGAPPLVRRLRERGARVDLLFLDCADAVLINRYRETRRVHPLSPAGPVEAGIERERALLADLQGLADHALDTSAMNVHQLRDAVVAWVSGETRRSVINLISFGYRYGIPSAELLFDVRFLPNPHFQSELRPLSGLDEPVVDFVLKQDHTQEWLTRLAPFLDFVLERYDDEGKAYLSIGVGCTGGRHRSVALVRALAERLRATGRSINVEHRDIERGI